MADLEKVEINLQIPGLGGIKGIWKPNGSERKAAWELYVELITRISVVPLKEGTGLLREALNSLHSLFAITREILREHGSSVAKSKKGSTYSFGQLAVIILNYAIRPVLAKWHPELEAYEAKQPGTASVKEHEDEWERNADLRKELDDLRVILIGYSNHLAAVAQVKPLDLGKAIPPTKRKKNGK